MRVFSPKNSQSGLRLVDFLKNETDKKVNRLDIVSIPANCFGMLCSRESYGFPFRKHILGSTCVGLWERYRNLINFKVA